MDSTTEPVLVLDMTTLHYRSTGQRAPLRVTTRCGQVLGIVHPRRNEQRSDQAFRAMDAALRDGAVFDVNPDDPRTRHRLRIALYNPFSGEVAYGPIPKTVAFTSAAPLELDIDGTRGVVTHTEDGPVLQVGDRLLYPVSRSARELTRVIAGQATG